MKEERFVGRAILSAAVSYALWMLIGFIGAILIQMVSLVYLATMDSIGDNVMVVLFFDFAFAAGVIWVQFTLAKYTMKKICKTIPTTILAFRIFGWFIIAVTFVNVMISSVYGETPNALAAVIGYLFLRAAKNLQKSVAA